MMDGGGWVMYVVLIGCSFLSKWAISDLVMRVGACTDELCLRVGAPGCVAVNCVGGSGRVAFRGACVEFVVVVLVVCGWACDEFCGDHVALLGFGVGGYIGPACSPRYEIVGIPSW
jgi:hypothetical protein